MALEVGSQIAHYRVTALIGEGGMGQVYEATDTKLNRQVALKILPEAFASDPDRLARFQREAQVLASLNHPGIAGIYGLEEQDGTKALVLELVEGPTLADRIAQGPIPVDEALPIAKQIAEALEAAHEQGIIHRDLKPANIKLRPDGAVKVLDFGLAKALDTAPEGDPNQSPTLTSAATQMGVIMGTAAYMSPEQAAGKPVDRRTDIWAFGVVFYEMLTGDQLYAGETVSHVLAKVLDREPDLSKLPASTPVQIRKLLKRCLEKNDKRRLRDIGEAVLQLEDVDDDEERRQETPAVSPAATAPESAGGWRRLVPASLAGVGILSLLVSGLIVLRGGGAPQVGSGSAVRHYELDVGTLEGIPAGGERLHLAYSPDGSQLAYVKRERGVTGLYLRDLTQGVTRRLQGTEGAYAPAFSPDGQWVVYNNASSRTLEKVLVQGGDPIVLSPAWPGASAAWFPDDTIVFASQPIGQFGGLFEPTVLYRIPAEGGDPVQLSAADDTFFVVPVRFPGTTGVVGIHDFSPDAGTTNFDLFDLESGERRTLLSGVSAVRATSTGHLVFTRGNDLWVVGVDPATGELLGDQTLMLGGLEQGYIPSFAVSADGSLAFLPGETVTPRGTVFLRSLEWVDRQGAVEPAGVPAGHYSSPAVSPDGSQIAVVAFDGDRYNLWVYEVATGRGQPLTDTGGHAAMAPVWTPDGRHILFSEAEGVSGVTAFPGHVSSVAADGSSAPQELFREDGSDFPTSLTPDGNTLIFTRILDSDLATRTLMSRSLAPDGVETELAAGAANTGAGAVSPDGRWLAYWSDQTGQPEVYIQPFPGGGARTPVSIGGGQAPKWSLDGRALFYRSGRAMMAVDVETEPSLRIGRPRELFDGFGFRVGTRGAFVPEYDVGPDGRFLMVRGVAASATQTEDNVVVIANWLDEVRARVPVP